MAEPLKRPENFRQASRADYFSGKPGVMPGQYTYDPTSDQLKIGALQRLADANERIAAALEKLAGIEAPTPVPPQEGGQSNG